MENSFNAYNTRDKLFQLLVDSNTGWASILKTMIYSEDFNNILLYLANEVNSNRRFTPPLSKIFNSFLSCPTNKLKVVIIGMDPYNKSGVADGVAFSCSETSVPQPSLRFIQKAIASTVYDNKKNISEMNNDLRYLSEQGVLLMNAALTVQIEKAGSHLKVWKPFTAFLLDMLNYVDTPLVYLLLGKDAQQYTDLISDKHIILTASHPASAAYNRLKEWNCNDVFNECNNYLETLGKEKIIW